MRRILTGLFASILVLQAQTAEKKALYSAADAPLTQASDGSAAEISQQYLAAAAGLAPTDLPSVFLAKQYVTAHNGVTHLVYRQQFQGIEVFNADWVTNIAADGSVLSAGGILYNDPGTLSLSAQATPQRAVRAAAMAVNARIGARYAPFEVNRPAGRAAQAGAVRYAAGEFGADIDGRLAWYGMRGSLTLAYIFQVMDEDGVNGYSVVVEADTYAVLEKLGLTMAFQSPPKGLIYDQGSPQPTPAGIRTSTPPPIVDRVSVAFSGDPIASPGGWVTGTETLGNNAVAGENLLGVPFAAPRTTQEKDGGFSFPLTLGVGAPDPVVFADAATSNLFYWVNRVHDLHYRYGFDEAAGNFQQSNFGRGGVAADPVLAYSHYASSAPGGAALRNAFFTVSSTEDGAPGMLAMYSGYSTLGGFFTDAALDAEVIMHEYTHGVSLRLVRQGYSTFQGAAMGEAWSDFYATEYITPDGAPPDGIYAPAQYFFQYWGTGLRTRPFSTNMDVNPLTYADLGHVRLAGPEVHADGEIWVEALWEARANLIAQFGETDGRRRIRQLVMDGMKLSLPAPSMVDMRDAILLADRAGFHGESQTQLWAAFAKRGLGALAHSADGITIHVVPSFEVPSPTARLKFYEDSFVVGENVRLLMADSNYSQPTARVQLTTSAGDLEDVILHRSGNLYIGTIATSGNFVAKQNFTLNLGTGDAISAYYVDFDPGTGPAKLVQTTVSSTQPYIFTSSAPDFTFTRETRLTTSRAPVQFILPFEFPFFSNKYTLVTLLPTGAVMLGNSSLTSALSGAGCTDLVEFRRLAAVAPLFLNLTFGTAQPAEGLYYSQNASGSITFRWAAETNVPFVSTTGQTLGEPVNFAVTLRQDGLITFQYGSGNQNLQTASSAAGCQPGPVTGVANGHDVYASNVVVRSYTNVATLRFEPPFNNFSVPVATVEKPAAGAHAGGVLTVSGIAYDAAGLTRVEIFVDDVIRAVTTPTISRLDICSQQTVPGCPLVGYQAQIDLAARGIAAGPHTVWVRATNLHGGFADTQTRKIAFTVDADGRQPKGAIELPLAGAEVKGILIMRGYAYFDDLRVLRVDPLIDGLAYPGASYGANRADICGSLTPQPPTCPAIGWTALIDTATGAPPLPDGPHTLQLRVQDETGRYSMLPDKVAFTVKNGAVTYPVGVLTSPAPNAHVSGLVPLNGYAYSPGGRVIQVGVIVDYTLLDYGLYGLPRRSDCDALKDVPACPNIGFSVILDTSLLSNGVHSVGIVITNDGGVSTIIPNLNVGGMNIYVENP